MAGYWKACSSEKAARASRVMGIRLKNNEIDWGSVRQSE